MENIHFFSRYSSQENFATNNTLLLLSRINLIDRRFFETLLNHLTGSTDFFVGPSFSQQRASGGKGIPDGMIQQQSFKIVVETKLWDGNFWGKEDYVSHFQNEQVRILLTLSRGGIKAARRQEFETKLAQYDAEQKAPGRTLHADLSFHGLIERAREVIIDTNTRHKLEIEELLNDYEGFISDACLLDDTDFRMHVPAITSSESDNLKYNLYYNRTYTNETPHRFVGLYKNKAIRYIGETKCIVIAQTSSKGMVEYNVLKGTLTTDLRQRLERFFLEQGWGNKGEVKFHLFDELHSTNFAKKSSYGIMGPRHFILKQHIKTFPKSFDSKWLATELDGKGWT